MLARRLLPKVLALSLALSSSAITTASAVSTSAPSECATAPDSVCEYLANETEAPPTSSSSSVLPGAIEPLPVNPVIEAEFNAHITERKGRGLLAVASQGAEVRLFPGLVGGWAGWCMSTLAGGARSTRCGVAPNAHTEIGYESWEAGGVGRAG